jgi:RNA polymerase sigma-70 factor (ECF subfamily)
MRYSTSLTKVWKRMNPSVCAGTEAVASATGGKAPVRARAPFRRAVTARRVLPMSDVDDGELMARYAAGDLQAFEALYRRHRRTLYRYLARHVRDPEVANDLFQEVWGKVIAVRERYEPRAKFSTFLYRIAHNCFIDHCRRHAGRPDLKATPVEDFVLENSLPTPPADLPDTRAELAETLARYRSALAALPPEQRDTFLLYEESGLSLKEIGAISGVSMETAKSRLRYALTKLRLAMSPRSSGNKPVPTTQEPGT